MASTRMGRSQRALDYNAAHAGDLAAQTSTDYARDFFAGWHRTREEYAAARAARDTEAIIRLAELLAAYQDEFYRTAF